MGKEGEVYLPDWQTGELSKHHRTLLFVSRSNVRTLQRGFDLWRFYIHNPTGFDQNISLAKPPQRGTRHFGNAAIYRRPSRALETFAAVSQEKGSLVDHCSSTPAGLVTNRIVSRIAQS